jgi:hypothetical protein
VQCDFCQSDAYKNWTDSVAKLVGQPKSDQFWLFRVNEPLIHLKNVDDEGEDVADEEDDDDAEQHGGHADLALLKTGQLGTFGVGSSDLPTDNAGNTKGGSITVQLTSCLTGLD